MSELTCGTCGSVLGVLAYNGADGTLYHPEHVPVENMRREHTFPLVLDEEDRQNGMPWKVNLAYVHARRARIETNHGQTVERLSMRGGLSPEELYAAAHDWDLRKMLAGPYPPVETLAAWIMAEACQPGIFGIDGFPTREDVETVEREVRPVRERLREQAGSPVRLAVADVEQASAAVACRILRTGGFEDENGTFQRLRVPHSHGGFGGGPDNDLDYLDRKYWANRAELIPGEDETTRDLREIQRLGAELLESLARPLEPSDCELRDSDPLPEDWEPLRED